MGKISEYLKKIKNAIYGEEVRDSIIGAIEECYKDAAEQGNANMEVIDARGNFETLKKRLDNVDNINLLNQENIIDQFSVAKNYTVGDLCIYDNILYKCIVDVQLGNEFNSKNWIQTTISEVIKDTAKETIEKATEFESDDNFYKLKNGKFIDSEGIKYPIYEKDGEKTYGILTSVLDSTLIYRNIAVNGNIEDFDNCLKPGIYRASNIPFEKDDAPNSYGILLVLTSDGKSWVKDDQSCWIFQFFITTSNKIWFRCGANDNDWMSDSWTQII